MSEETTDTKPHRRDGDGAKGTIQNIGLIIAAFTSGNFNAVLNGDIEIAQLLTPTTIYILLGYVAVRYSPRIGELPGGLAAGWRTLRIAVRDAFAPLPPMMLAFGVACFVLSGCATMAGVQQSKSEVTIRETVQHENGQDTFEIITKDRGDGEKKTSVDYTGEAEAGKQPFIFRVNTDGKVSSPWTPTVAQGYSEMLKAAPSTLAGLTGAIGVVSADPALDAAPGMKQWIIQTLIERFISGGLPIPLP